MARADIKTDDLPNLTAWIKRIQERPAAQAGLNVPEKNKILEAVKVCAVTALQLPLISQSIDLYCTSSSIIWIVCLGPFAYEHARVIPG